MKFTDGAWQLRPGVQAQYAQQVHEMSVVGRSLVAKAPTRVIADRGDMINCPLLTVSLSSPLPDVVRVRVEHWQGGEVDEGFELLGERADQGVARIVGASQADGGRGEIVSGGLTARIEAGAAWELSFEAEGRRLATSGPRSVGLVRLAQDAEVDRGIVSNARAGAQLPRPDTYLYAQLSLGVGEHVYGLGERFGPLVKNGQTVQVWNADAGTSTEQSYKNVPFYLTDRGYGVLVNHRGHVSFEVGSESVERVQFSVPGEALEYLVIYGPTPREILQRYTELTGRPPAVPAWSYGMWLTTSFTTDYDEETVASFVDGMAERDIPLSVFHFDCFWMRGFSWCDFEWDPEVFPDPAGMLERLHARGLKVCVWVNPYISQHSPLFAEAKDAGFLVKRTDGSVWQWDLWQPGMALVDFTNDDATRWYQDKLRRLVDQGVDAFKTDFGERIPLDVSYADGTDPELMHNWYAQLYNAAVFEVLHESRGEGQSLLFARSATVGGQRQPIHWGGDPNSTYEAMAATLRGGLSLALSGFGFWSHDIGGFEGTPDPVLFKRWVAFGLLSSHSRLHGSKSYRVPWAFDEADPGAVDGSGLTAVEVTRKFARLKNRLMPYLFAAGHEATQTGTPVMRPMQLEFPGDPAVAYLDRQYMLGQDLLVAPVFDAGGEVDLYLPAGSWTNFWTGEVVEGGGWRREVHDVDSVPLYVRQGAVLPLGSRHDRPDYDYLDGLEFRVYPGSHASERQLEVVTSDGRTAVFTISPDGACLRIVGPQGAAFVARRADQGHSISSDAGTLVLGA